MTRNWGLSQSQQTLAEKACEARLQERWTRFYIMSAAIVIVVLFIIASKLSWRHLNGVPNGLNVSFGACTPKFDVGICAAIQTSLLALLPSSGQQLAADERPAPIANSLYR
jgi:hypothetical protein